MLLDTVSYRTFLSEELTRRIKSNSRYSQRAFARHLGLSPGELSEILRGKRGLSLKSALRIAKSLGLNSTEAKHLIHLTQVEKSQTYDGRALLETQGKDIFNTAESQQLTLDMFHAVSEWYYFAILNLADCAGFKWDANWISRRLGISRAEIQIAIERLERLGLLERKSGKLVVSKEFVMAPGGAPSEAIRHYHRQILELAAQALAVQKVPDREITGIGFPLDPKHISSIKKDISEFQDEIVAKYSKGKKTEVYQLEIAFFRLTQEENHEK